MKSGRPTPIITLNDQRIERSANGRIIPGLIPGLFAAKSGLLPCFVRFSCPSLKTRELGKPFIFKRLTGPSDRIRGYAIKLWKLGCTSASGAIASTIIAATASVRNVTARRSTMTAINTTAVIKNERCVATSAPDSRR
jgi:hypothetical protein